MANTIESVTLESVTSLTPGWTFLGTGSCEKCGSWNAESGWRSPEGEEYIRHEWCRCDEAKE